jgi:hypothetical protein
MGHRGFFQLRAPLASSGSLPIGVDEPSPDVSSEGVAEDGVAWLLEGHDEEMWQACGSR